MARDTKFQLDTAAAAVIIQGMMMPTVQQSAQAILSRARSMAGSMSSDPPEMELSTRIGTIKRGVRAIATITANGKDDHQNYIGNVALRKAKDAGRV